MKIVHISSGNIASGSFLGLLNLHEKLIKNKIDSVILNDFSFDKNNIKKINFIDDTISSKVKLKAINFLNKLPKVFYYKRSSRTFSNSFFGIDISQYKEIVSADLLHIHWIGNSYSNLAFIDKINKPIVWTLRDMWAFTGGCHYSLNCNKFKFNCGKCNLLNSNYKKDLSYWNYNIKKNKNYKNINFVAISNWLKKEALKSKIFKKKKIDVIYNGVDKSKFYFEINKKFLKKNKIPLNKKILLFGAQYIDADYKGLKYFIKSLNKIDTKNYFVIFFGKFYNTHLLNNLKIHYKIFGQVNKLNHLRTLYSISNVYVMSSIQEGFGKTAVESLLCGTPVVFFKKTAISEIILHKKNGYCADFLDTYDLYKGITWITKKQKKKFKKICINYARKKFDSTNMTNKYIKLYKKLLER